MDSSGLTSRLSTNRFRRPDDEQVNTVFGQVFLVHTLGTTSSQVTGGVSTDVRDECQACPQPHPHLWGLSSTSRVLFLHGLCIALYQCAARAPSVLAGPGFGPCHRYVEGSASVRSTVGMSAVATTVRKRTDVRLAWGAVA